MPPFKSLILLTLICLISLSCKDAKKENSAVHTMEPLVMNAIQDFEFNSGASFVPFYIDSSRNALAINALEYMNKFSSAKATFSGQSGRYNINMTSLKETDGESTYKIIIDDKPIGSFQNPASEVEFEPHTFSLRNIDIDKGQEIEIQFNSHSNNKIPEGDGHAFARGRWQKITFHHVK